MFSTFVKKVLAPSFRPNEHSPDDLLWTIVDACVSDVAVLDETGSLIYASRAWIRFEHNPIENTGAGATYFESCRRFTQSDEEPRITLADDIQRLLRGPEKEFHRRYYFDSLIDPRPFVVHAARLNLSSSCFRILVTREELSMVQEAFRDSKESLLEFLGSKRTEETLKDLGGRLIAAQEEERRRVARELHDDFNQRLAVLSIGLEQLGNKIQKPLDLRRSIERLQTQAHELAAEIHRLSYKLHPAKLDHLGLAAAIKSLCAELNQSEKLKVDFFQTKFSEPVDKDITLCVFRIAQESLRNCVKHSHAESVRVVLTRTRNAIRLVVSDNGCGFNTNSDSMERGLGFISMKERLHLVGGKINVYSKPLCGTRIEVSVPLKVKAEAAVNPTYSTALDE